RTRPAGGGAGTAITPSRCRASRVTASSWSGRARRPGPIPSGLGCPAARAGALPVDVRERHRVTGLLREGDRVVGVQAEDEDGARVDVGARLVVGADGRASAVAHALGLMRPHRLQRLALIQHVSGIEGVHDRGEIYVDPPDYSILKPGAPGLVN